MAFFGYDPYDYHYAAPRVNYAYPYYHHRQHQPTAARSAGQFYPAAAEPVAVRPRQAPAVEAVTPKPRARTVSIPVHFVGSDDPGQAAVTKKRAVSADAAAVCVQAAARGFLARKAVRALRAVEREAEEVAGQVAREAAELRGDARARVAVGEALMRLLLRLDAVRGARDFRRRVAKRVLALQDAVDALEPRSEAPVAEEPKSEVTESATAEEMTEEGDNAPDLPDATECGAEIALAEAAAEMEVDVDRAAAEQCAAEETEQAPDDADQGSDVSDNADTEGESEMVMEQQEPAAQNQSPAAAEPPRPQPAAAEAGGADAKKVMGMVAALCERSAQQCAVIGALAERVDALERAVRRVEDAERRRRRAKKLKKEGRGSNHNKCYFD